MALTDLDGVYRTIAAKIEGVENSKAIVQILRKMLDPQQAQVAAALPGVPEELAARLGRSIESIKKDLKYMYEIGLGTPSARSGKWNLPRTYMLLVDKVGSHHRKFLPLLGPEYLDLWLDLEEEHLTRLKEEKGTLATSGGNRIIPAYLAVKGHSELQPWENMKAILQMASKISVVSCTCRLRNRKRTCQMHTDEVCFLLNRDADYAVDSGAGQYFTVDQGLKVIEDCEKLGAIHIATNTRAVANLLCNCCRDCCVFMRRLDKLPDDRTWFRPSRFLASIDPDRCQGCGMCVDRCLFDAITMKKKTKGKGKGYVNSEKCMGCGNCAITCSPKAIELKCVRPEEHVPRGMWLRPGEVRDEGEYGRYLTL